MAHMNRLIHELDNPSSLADLIPEATDSEVSAALLFAAMRSELRAVEVLVAASSCDAVYKALSMSVSEGKSDIVTLLLESGKASDDRCALMKDAITHSHYDLIGLLINLGEPIARLGFALRFSLKIFGVVPPQLFALASSSLNNVFLYEVEHAKANENDGAPELIERLFTKISGRAQIEASEKIDRSLVAKIPSFERWFQDQELRNDIAETLAPFRTCPGGQTHL